MNQQQDSENVDADAAFDDSVFGTLESDLQAEGLAVKVRCEPNTSACSSENEVSYDHRRSLMSRCSFDNCQLHQTEAI